MMPTKHEQLLIEISLAPGMSSIHYMNQYWLNFSYNLATISVKMESNYKKLRLQENVLKLFSVECWPFCSILSFLLIMIVGNDKPCLSVISDLFLMLHETCDTKSFV